MFLPAYRAADPVRTYYVFKGAWSFLFALAFTLSMVYYVGLDPLQLVLVGTTLELACFLFEVPTMPGSPTRSARTGSARYSSASSRSA
jgi:hypothetical protein